MGRRDFERQRPRRAPEFAERGGMTSKQAMLDSWQQRVDGKRS